MGTLLGEANLADSSSSAKLVFRQSPVSWPNYTAGPLTPKHTVLHLMRLDTVTQPNNTAIIENFALYYIDLATLLTHISYSYPYPYTRNTTVSVTFTTYNAIQKCRAHHGDALFACPGPHSLQLRNTMSKYTRKRRDLIITVRKHAN